MHSIGSVILEKLLNADGGDYKGRSIIGNKGQVYEFMEYRDKNLLTVLGKVKVKRAYYYDRESSAGFCPKDKALDIEGTSFSPGMRRIMGRVGASIPFGLGHEDIKEMVGIDVTAKEIERMSHKLGEQTEEFIAGQAKISLADNIIPIKSIPKMYVYNSDIRIE
jgi:hypothetical protein